MARAKNPSFQRPSYDQATLNMTFDSCVLEGSAECQYIQYSNPQDFGGQRSLIAQFCGHGEVNQIWTYLRM